MNGTVSPAHRLKKSEAGPQGTKKEQVTADHLKKLPKTVQPRKKLTKGLKTENVGKGRAQRGLKRKRWKVEQAYEEKSKIIVLIKYFEDVKGGGGGERATGEKKSTFSVTKECGWMIGKKKRVRKESPQRHEKAKHLRNAAEKGKKKAGKGRCGRRNSEWGKFRKRI